MTSRRMWFPHSVFYTAAVLLALSQSAFADGGSTRLTERLLIGEVPAAELSLPTSLADWTEAANAMDPQEAPLLSLSLLPQGRLNTKPPFIDFSKLEVGGYTGMVAYSSKFEADPDWIFGLCGRLPIPGIPLDKWGVWGELWLSHIARDIPFYYPNSRGTWYGGAVGADFDLIHNEYIYLRPRAGILYAYWNGIHALENGSGILAGLQLGILWIKHTPQAALVLTPELTYDGKSWIGFLNFGFQVDF